MRLIKGTKEYDKAYERWVREGNRYSWHFENQAKHIFEWMEKQTENDAK